MTVSELIKKLEEIPNQNKIVEILIGTRIEPLILVKDDDTVVLISKVL